MIINPDKPGKEFWDIFVVLLTIYTTIEVPLRIVFGFKLTGTFYVLEILISAAFSIDIVLNFFTAIRKKQTLIVDHAVIKKHYLRSWFAIDFLAAIPFFLIFSGPLAEAGHLFRVLRILQLNRLFKLSKVSYILKSRLQHHMINPGIFRLLFFVFFISLVAHWVACGWILLGGVPDAKNNLEMYSDALYWTITTLSTVGYGDVVPHTIVQKYYAIAIMLVGVGSYGYVIGNVASFLANLDIVKAEYKKKLEQITAFLNYRSIPVQLRNRVTEYYEHIWDSRLGHNEELVLHDLPEPLKTDIALHMRSDLITKVPFFDMADEQLLREIVLLLKPRVYIPDSYIIKKGKSGDCMFIISAGQVHIVSEKTDEVYATLGEGSFFGEMSLVLNMPRTASVKTSDYCDVYVLEKSDFEAMRKKFPSFNKHVKKITKERLHNFNIRKRKQKKKDKKQTG